MNKHMNQDLAATLLNEQQRLLEKEKMSLVCGNYYRKHAKQERASYFFKQANNAFKKRQEIQDQINIIFSAIGINIPNAEQFVKPISL